MRRSLVRDCQTETCLCYAERQILIDRLGMLLLVCPSCVQKKFAYPYRRPLCAGLASVCKEGFVGLTILDQIEDWKLPFPYGQMLF